MKLYGVQTGVSMVRPGPIGQKIRRSNFEQKVVKGNEAAYVPSLPGRETKWTSSNGSHVMHSSVSPDGTYDVDQLDVDNLDLSDPFGVVSDVMTTENLRFVTPTDPLTEAAAKLDKITGLAVLDENEVVVGVVSIKVRGLFRLAFCYVLGVWM